MSQQDDVPYTRTIGIDDDPSDARSSTDGRPDVSVIVLAHRKAQLLHRCLAELRSHRSSASFEVVVVANGVSNDVLRVLSDHPWIVRVDSRSNRGFAGGANLGAQRSRGSRLLFLNDDAMVTDGWLDALMHVLDTRPEVAAVGSLIIDRDGRVLEFGSTFDGWSPRALDRGRPLDELAHEGSRDVAYTSACSLLIRRAAFEHVGAFDEAYYPAYYEDADLALRLWEAGHVVTATPSSVVIHAESASTSAPQRDVVFDRSAKVFRGSWFGKPPMSGGGQSMIARLPARQRPAIVIDDFVPRAASGSGLARARQLIESLTHQGLPVLFHARNRRFELDHALLVRGVRPLLDLSGCSDETDPLCVIASRPHNVTEGAATAARFSVPFIYDAEARFSARLETELLLDLTDERRRAVIAELATMLDIERRVAGIADVIVTISAEEASWFRDRGAPDVRVVDPFPDHCEPGSAGFDERSGALFIAGWLGGTESPNGDGLRWLAREVLPEIVRRDPNFRLLVTGASPPAELLKLASANLEFVGEVSDLAALLDQVRVSVSPIRFGAGVKLKTVDSLARGVPTVATTRGAEGLDELWHGGMVVSDDPIRFADAIVRLTSDSSAWSRTRAALVVAGLSHRSNADAVWRDIIAVVSDANPPTRAVLRNTSPHRSPTANALNRPAG